MAVSSFAELQDRFRKTLEIHLLSQCKRSDGRSQEKSIEIASQVLSDCFVKSPSLLEKWQGQDNLEAFLKTVTYNRLKSWWSSRDYALEVNSDSRAITEAAESSGAAAIDWQELKVMEMALTLGVQAAYEKCPEGLIFMRLKGLHAVDQRALSSVWSHHESQTSRKIKEAMALIRATAMKHAEYLGVELDIDTLQKVLQSNPSILLGRDSALLKTEDIEILRRLANGHRKVRETDYAIELMYRNANALEFFAQLLNQNGQQQAVFVRDPALDGLAARLEVHVVRSLEILRPTEISQLISPLMRGLFSDALQSITADGGTLWWRSPGEPILEAVFNPFEPDIVGKRQPLASGIISLVLANSETICVDAATSHLRHSPAVDAALGKSTQSMIAVPFVVMNRLCGVLTAVRLHLFAPFALHETEVLERQAIALASMLESILIARISHANV